MKNSNNTIWNRTSDLLACSALHHRIPHRGHWSIEKCFPPAGKQAPIINCPAHVIVTILRFDQSHVIGGMQVINMNDLACLGHYPRIGCRG